MPIVFSHSPEPTSQKRIVRSSYGGARPQRDFPLLAQACLEGRLQLAPYITSRIGLQDINEGMDRLRGGLDIRAVILRQLSA